MDTSGMAGAHKAREHSSLGREYADDWIKKKPPMGWFCTISAFCEVGRHNDLRANACMCVHYKSPANPRGRSLSGI